MCAAGLSPVTRRLLEMLLGGSSENGMPGTPRFMAAFMGWGVFPRSGFLSGEGSGRRAGLCTRSLSTLLWRPQEGAVLSHEASFLAELRSGVTCCQRVGLGGTQREGWQRAGCSHLVLEGGPGQQPPECCPGWPVPGRGCWQPLGGPGCWRPCTQAAFLGRWLCSLAAGTVWAHTCPPL